VYAEVIHMDLPKDKDNNDDKREEKKEEKEIKW
jgi:hypothetical protein